MAVIVQELVPAEAAGVIFTADPVTGRADRITVEAVPGLGETLVSGRTDPDRLRCQERPPYLRYARRPREVEACVGHAGGHVPAGLAASRDNLYRRGNRQAARPHGDAGGVRFRLPWTWNGRRLRKDLPPAGQADNRAGAREVLEDRQVWSNINTGEILPDVVTPRDLVTGTDHRRQDLRIHLRQDGPRIR